MAYAPHVRKSLQRKTEVLDVPENCEDCHKYLKRLQKWLKEADLARLDIVHFNCDLHDIKRKFKSRKKFSTIFQSLKKISRFTGLSYGLKCNLFKMFSRLIF